MVFNCATKKLLLRHKTPLETDANSVTTLQLSDKELSVVDRTDECSFIASFSDVEHITG